MAVGHLVGHLVAAAAVAHLVIVVVVVVTHLVVVVVVVAVATSVAAGLFSSAWRDLTIPPLGSNSFRSHDLMEHCAATVYAHCSSYLNHNFAP